MTPFLFLLRPDAKDVSEEEEEKMDTNRDE